MEEKDLQPGEITEFQAEGISEPQTAEPPVAQMESTMGSTMAAVEPAIGTGSAPVDDGRQERSTRPEEPSARERLRVALLEQGPAKVSNFMRPAGLFEDYEVTNAKQMPFFMRVFAASALLHLVIFATAMQLPVVVETTCESTEFTQRLCDTMYVASLMRPDRNWVDQAVSDPTQIPDAGMQGDVTMIATADFQYPEGFWTLRDEIEGRLVDETVTPGINGDTFTFGNSNSTINAPPPEIDLSKPPKLPKQNKRAVTGSDIDEVFKTSPGPEPPLVRGGTKVTDKSTTADKNPAGIPDPKSNSNTNTNTTAQNVTPVNPLPEGSYNKQPLYAFRDNLVKWREEGQNNFYQQFQYSVTGTIDKEGKLVVEGQPTFNGDPKMQEIIKQAVASFSDSGMLKALKDLQSKTVRVTMAQDGNQFLIRMETAQGTEKEARGIFNGINIFLEGAKMFVSSGVEAEADPINKQKELTTLELLKMAQLKRDGKNITIDFVTPNKFAEDMYQTYKKDLEEKKSNRNPDGIATNANRDLGTSK